MSRDVNLHLDPDINICQIYVRSFYVSIVYTTKSVFLQAIAELMDRGPVR